MLASVPYLQICTLLARCSGATIMSLLPNVISLTRNEPNVWFRRHRLSGRGIQGTDSAAPRDCWYRIGGSSAGARLWDHPKQAESSCGLELKDGPLGILPIFGPFANLLPIFCWVHGVISCAFHVLSAVYCSSTFHCSDGNIWARGSFFSARNRYGAGRSIKSVRPSITICWGDIERQIDPICQTSSLTPWTL